ncbi:MAG: hypothetical protein PHQ40_12825 [Anaerolineaceae bacterium]|nr:hypothetical protein [Anaerolineaceae bacterium]
MAHIVLSGDMERAAMWIPAARSAIRRQRGIDPQRGNIALGVDNGDTIIRASYEGTQEYISIDAGGGFFYEFFTTVPVDNFSYVDAGHDPATQLWISGRGTRMQVAAGTGTPIFDATDTVYTPGNWTIIPAGQQKTPFNTWASWQHQRMYEYIHWPNNNGDEYISSTAGVGPYQSNLVGFRSMLSAFLWSDSYWPTFAVDSGWDIGATHYSRGSVQYLQLNDLPEGSWWRHCAIQNVGGRRFVVATDAKSRFYVYPLLDYGAGGISQFDPRVKIADPPFPAWVNTGYDNALDNKVWEFNKDATRAVSIQYQSIIPTTGSPVKVQAGITFTATIPTTLFDTSPTVREDYPGLVELGIGITITGPNANEFSVSLTLERTLNPASGRVVLGAGYAFMDTRLPVSEDTLITFEALVYSDISTVTHGSPPVTIEAATSTQQEVVDAMYWSADTGGNPTIDIGLFDVVFTMNANLSSTPIMEIAATNEASQLLGGTAITTLNVGGVDYELFNGEQRGYNQISATNDIVFIKAVDLRTMSAAASHNSVGGASYGWRLWVYGALVDSAQGAGTPSPPSTASSRTPLPPSLANLALLISRRSYRSTHLDSFSIHPQGHIAIALSRLFPTLPIPMDIDFIMTDKGKRYAHRGVYNRAFGDGRDYSYYTVNPDAVRGLFRSFGIFYRR